MRSILALAWLTFRDALRQKLAANLVIFALALVAVSITISALTFGEQWRIIVNLGLSTMEIVGTLIAVFLGAGLVAREVERRTLYPIVAKPVSRVQYVIGRYLGLVLTTTLNLAVMTLAFLVVLAAYTGGLGFLGDAPVATVLGSLAIRFAMIAALATLFSTFTTTTLAAIFALSFSVAGQLTSDLVRYWSQQGGAAAIAGKVAYLVVPNLESLNFKDAMVYKDALPAAPVALALGYGVLYAAGVVALAAAVFSRRDLR